MHRVLRVASRALLWVVVLQIVGSQVVTASRGDSRLFTSECAEEAPEREKLDGSDDVDGFGLDGLVIASEFDVCSALEHSAIDDHSLHFPSGESPTHACRPPPLG